MKTQISKNSYRKDKRYSGVYQQQGRMLTDADWNETVDILKGELADALQDIVGNGSPRVGAVNLTDDRKIKPGDLYVDGLHALLPGREKIGANEQPDLPGYQPLPATGPYVIYADVWERTVNCLEDGDLRDPGLHGADTCTRRQTMLQVKWRPEPVERGLLPRQGNGLLSLDLHVNLEAGDPCDPCAGMVDSDTGRVGNYLFRLEVHDVQGAANNPDEITLKWSSENGAEQFEAMAADKMPPGFISEKYVYEFFSETSEKHLGVHLATGFTPVVGILRKSYDIPAGQNEPNQFVRRWDGFCVLHRSGTTWSLAGGRDKGVHLSLHVAPTAHGHVSLDNDFTVNLEALRLTLVLRSHRISPGHTSERTFVRGDYWLAPVRETIHQAGSAIVTGIQPEGIVHHYLQLARVKNDGTVERFHDDADRRRHSFPPLTDIRARDVGYTADCTSGLFSSSHDNVKKALDQVCNIQAQNVGFTKPCDTSLFQGNPVATVQDALALLCDIKAQQVSFTAQPDCSLLNQPGINTVQDAINTLCRRPAGSGCMVTVGKDGQFKTLPEAVKTLLEEGRLDICLCLLPGNHELPDGLQLSQPDLRINICGCGYNVTRISLGNELTAEGIHSFNLDKVQLVTEKTDAGLRIINCREVALKSNRINGLLKNSSLVTLDVSSRVHLADNIIGACIEDAFALPGEIFGSFDITEILFGILERDTFITQTRRVAQELAALNAEVRKELLEKFIEVMEAYSNELSEIELVGYEMFATALQQDKIDTEFLSSALWKIRQAAQVTRPATAVVIETALAATILENNDIDGFLSFYGLPAGKPFTKDELGYLLEIIKEIQFVPAGSNLQLHNNRLTRVVIGQKMVEIIRSITGNQRQKVLHGIFSAALLTDNTIELPDNYFVARGHNLSSTRFMVELLNDDAGFVLGENAVYLGCYAPDRNPACNLFSLTHLSTEAATLGLNIVGSP